MKIILSNFKLFQKPRIYKVMIIFHQYSGRKKYEIIFIGIKTFLETENI